MRRTRFGSASCDSAAGRHPPVTSGGRGSCPVCDSSYRSLRDPGHPARGEPHRGSSRASPARQAVPSRCQSRSCGSGQDAAHQRGVADPFRRLVGCRGGSSDHHGDLDPLAGTTRYRAAPDRPTPASRSRGAIVRRPAIRHRPGVGGPLAVLLHRQLAREPGALKEPGFERLAGPSAARAAASAVYGPSASAGIGSPGS
jgi:hypothetical protein